VPARLPFTSWSGRGSLPELVRTMRRAGYAAMIKPLAAMADRMLADARAHGKQIDDQTLLLIRRV
jgi:ApbE superfamily uncharacterized protein (UPF0280 family)